MEDPMEEESVSSMAKIEEVSTMLKTESRFFMGRERSEIQRLTDLLEDLNGFLEGAAANSVEKLTRESVKSWLEQTKENSEDVYACIAEENCLLKLSKVLQEPQLINFLSRAGRRFNMLNEIRKSSQSQPLPPPPPPPPPLEITENGRRKKEEFTKFYDRNVVLSFVEEYVRSKAKDMTTTWLIGGDLARSVLSLAGPVGIGKTTLARRFYEIAMAQDYFDCCYWVDVSGLYRIEDLRKIIIKQIPLVDRNDAEVLDTMRTTDLIGTLRQSLQAKRYMFVFDDVSHEEFWDFMKHGLPDNDRGSRVIVTTTSGRVVGSCNDASHDRVHKLGPLSDARSFELFCRIAFHNEPVPRCPVELEVLSREIVRLCKDFPFLIVAVAALLSKKEKLVFEWQKLRNGLKLEVEKNIGPLGVLQVVLALSFYDLPNYLRPCLLYFSIFPQGSIIPNEKLFQMWIAEGFIEGKTGKPLEQVAKEYLTELVHRDLVQPCQGFYGLDRFCQVDELTHNIVRERAGELEFSSIWDGKNSSSRRNCRRVSFHNVVSLIDTIRDYRTRSVWT